MSVRPAMAALWSGVAPEMNASSLTAALLTLVIRKASRHAAVTTGHVPRGLWRALMSAPAPCFSRSSRVGWPVRGLLHAL